jgi:potassium voltage-gated channel Shab-related subfamily B protein 1
MRVEKFKKASENTFNISNFTKISTNFIPEEHIETKKEFIDHPMFETIEIVCIVWFTIEYVLRIWSAPNRFQSMKSPLNIIDLVSILPFYVSLILDNFSNSHLSETDSVRKIFTLFRILRVLRIFKLARHSKGLKAFGQTIQKSSDEFVLLFFFLSIEVLLFSSLVYFAEKDEEGTQYTSIPATFWWAVISITTVGYGDMVPITVAGKLAGALCCISGILVIATPIPIIVNNFSDICVNQNKVEKVLKYKEARNQRMVEIEKRSETVKLIHKELESEEDLAKVCFIQKNKS